MELGDNPCAQRLSAIIAEVLRCSSDKISDRSFRELGGSSPDAVRIALALREELGLKVNPGELLASSALGELFAELAASAEVSQVPAGGDSPVCVAECVPLTWPQETVWYQSLLDADSSRHQFHALLHFDRVPSVDLLVSDLRALLTGHPGLRVRLSIDDDGRPWQLVPAGEPDARELAIPVITLDRVPDTPEELVTAVDADRPFDLAEGPLLRWTLALHLAGGATLVHSEHHLIHDGAAFELILQALAGGPRNPDERYLQYATQPVDRDHQRAAATAEECFSAQRELFPEIDAPGVDKDPFIRVPLPSELATAVRRTARAQGVSLFSALYAAFSDALGRLRHSRRFVLGTSVSNRPAGMEDVIGMFASTVPVVVDRRPGETPAQATRRTADALAEAAGRAHIPITAMVDATGSGRSGNDRGFITAAFSMHERLLGEVTVAGERARVQMGVFNGAAKFTLNAVVLIDQPGDGDGVTFMVDGARANVTEADLWALWRLFVEWLWEYTGVRPLPAADGGEADLVDAITRFAAQTPDAVALDDGSDSVTYARLVDTGDTFGAQIGEDVRVIGLLGPASTRFFACAYAALHSGRTYVPLDTQRHVDRVVELAQLAGCDLVVDLTADTDPDAAAVSERLAAVTRVVDWAALTTAPTQRSAPPRQDNLPAYIMFTSGSTGAPKGVVVERRSLSRLCHWASGEVGLHAGAVASQNAAVGFDASALEVWPALYSGARIVISPPEVRANPYGFADWLVRERVEVAFASTPVGEMLFELPWPRDCTLRVLTVGGDRLHAVDRDLPFRLVNMYGPTEATIVATAQTIELPAAVPPPIGRVVPYGAVRTVNAHGENVPPGSRAELWVGGGGVAAGYVDQPVQTWSRFVPDPHTPRGDLVFRTGDVVTSTADGVIEFVGRADRQVKVSGVRIELAEIEAIALRDPDVRHAAATMAAGPSRQGKRLRLFVVPAQGRGGVELVDRLRGSMPEFLRNLVVDVVTRIPLDANGKVNHTMNDVAVEETSDLSRYVRLFRDQLKVDDLGSSWFELGGSSLDAARVVSKAKRELGIVFSLRDLLGAKSVVDYLRRVAGEPADATQASARQEPLAQTVSTAVDTLWPALENLTVRDKIALAQRLMSVAVVELDA